MPGPREESEEEDEDDDEDDDEEEEKGGQEVATPGMGLSQPGVSQKAPLLTLWRPQALRAGAVFHKCT
jgi:hypothetical protein